MQNEDLNRLYNRILSIIPSNTEDEIIIKLEHNCIIVKINARVNIIFNFHSKHFVMSNFRTLGIDSQSIIIDIKKYCEDLELAQFIIENSETK